MTVQEAPPRRLLEHPLALPLAVALVAGLVVCSLFVGVYDLDKDAFGREIFFISRVPRTVALVLAGCAMSMSGLIMQLLTQNRFVEPTTVGTAEWAGLGLLLVTIVAPQTGIATKMVVASVAAFGGTLIFLAILSRLALRSSLVVPLVGIMLGAVVAAVSTYLAAQYDLLQMLGTWFQGSFTSVVRGRYETLWIILVVVVAAYLVADRFTIAGLGKETATSVGLSYERILLLGTLLVALATGVTTVVIGFLPFLGLVVPNLVSLARGDDLRSNIPWVCLGGVAIVTVCDIIGRTVRAPFEIPVSPILGAVGAFVFVALLLRQRRHG